MDKYLVSLKNLATQHFGENSEVLLHAFMIECKH
jgi:hypothetical protein